MIPLPWLDEQVPVYGRFATVAAPWLRLGANVVPILPGGKSPAVSGHGRPKDPKKGGLNLIPGSFMERGSPAIPRAIFDEWCRRDRDHNACVFPATLDATVIDVDRLELLDLVLEACGPTPYRTYSPREGGGVHLWYRGASKSRNAITRGVDVKSIGGYVLVPGCVRDDSATYLASPELVHALATSVLELPTPHPQWRRDLECLGRAVINPGRVDLASVADRLASRTEHRTIARCMRAVADGRPFAEPGERDGVIYRLVRHLVDAWPHADPEAVATLFAPSARLMEAESPVGIPILEAVRLKWARLVTERQAHDDEAEESVAERRRLGWRWVDLDNDSTADLEDGPLVVHQGRGYYLRIGESFVGPWVREDLSGDVLAVLDALYGTTIEDTPDLVRRFGARAHHVINSYVTSRTFWDAPSATLHVAAAPIRPELTPQRSEAVEQCIAAWAGPYVNELTRWMAGLLRTDVPCRALMLSGPPGTGKSLFVSGLGRLWPDGAAKMRDVLGRRFNASLAATSLAVSDDDTSPTESGEALAAFLREAVQDRVQRLERKHHDVSTVRGCMRFALATNDAHALVSGAVSYKLNDEALEAFGDRLLHIPVHESARGCWDRAGVTGADLVDGDMIARHVLWLHTLKAEPQERFWVGPADMELARFAVLSSGLRGEILYTIADLVDRGLTASWLRLRADGAVEVQSTALFDGWLDRPRGCTRRGVELAVAALARASTAEQPARIREGDTRARWHAIDRAMLAWYGEKCWGTH